MLMYLQTCFEEIATKSNNIGLSEIWWEQQKSTYFNVGNLLSWERLPKAKNALSFCSRHTSNSLSEIWWEQEKREYFNMDNLLNWQKITKRSMHSAFVPAILETAILKYGGNKGRGNTSIWVIYWADKTSKAKYAIFFCSRHTSNTHPEIWREQKKRGSTSIWIGPNLSS